MKNIRLFYPLPQLAIVFIVLVGLSACSSTTKMEKERENPLNPDQPISVTLWHYYSGHTKAIFDQLVNDFNSTVGVEKGIVVDAQSQGEIQQLETAVFDSATQTLGAQRLPDIFAAYPDNAYRVGQLIDLVDFEDYFSKDDLQAFQQDFLASGRISNNQKLYILPVATSTENLFMNKTIWDEFANETATSIEQLATWEGILDVAKAYHDWSGGKAFLAIDSPSNFMLMSTMQLGEEMFPSNDTGVQLHFEQQTAKKIWDTYYMPFINGYFEREGRFGSDDAKVGLVAAYIGSTVSSIYFPHEVTLSQTDIRPIENITLPYPVYEGAQPFAAQQGAGMSIVKSDFAHEYAAAEFLKWFTDREQNSSFAMSTAYFPVKTEALQADYLLSVLENEQIETSPALTASINTTIAMFEDYGLYGYKAFEGSFDVRNILNNHLIALIQQDLASLEQAITSEERAQKRANFSSDEHFVRWYDSFMTKLQTYFK